MTKEMKLKAILLTQDGGRSWTIIRQYYLTDLRNPSDFLNDCLQGARLQRVGEEEETSPTPES